MSKQAISPLRRRMIEDMEIRGFAAKTQRGYVNDQISTTTSTSY